MESLQQNIIIMQGCGGRGREEALFPNLEGTTSRGEWHCTHAYAAPLCLALWLATHVQSREETNSSRRRRQWQFSDAWKLGQKCSSTSPLTALNAITSLEDCLYNVLGSEFGSILFHLSWWCPRVPKWLDIGVWDCKRAKTSVDIWGLMKREWVDVRENGSLLKSLLIKGDHWNANWVMKNMWTFSLC